MQGVEKQRDTRRFLTQRPTWHSACLGAALKFLMVGCDDASVAIDQGLQGPDLGVVPDAASNPTLHLPCSPESDCSAGEQCAFDRDGEWWCMPTGLATEDVSCTASMTQNQTWSLCVDGLFCDVILQNPESLHPFVCRPPCDSSDDCGNTERCVDAATPGEGGLCRASECDYDGSGAAPFGQACMAWEFLGPTQASQDILVGISEQVRAGEPCSEPLAFCGEQERVGVCDGGSICRRTCRTVDDCEAGESCEPATVGAFHLESFDLFTIYSSQNLSLSTCREAP